MFSLLHKWMKCPFACRMSTCLKHFPSASEIGRLSNCMLNSSRFNVFYIARNGHIVPHCICVKSYAWKAKCCIPLHV